jgi:hypothetical protein
LESSGCEFVPVAFLLDRGELALNLRKITFFGIVPANDELQEAEKPSRTQNTSYQCNSYFHVPPKV